ncbi:hypothetical protein [Rhodomicrobium udaipurense]|uniref:Uncharacterized protein n=1 Tax=Rhodomicrobium udaipurense TaxID=1202716 RepID=A0A8I1KLF5_9HYPH|nr:hypothetical protein [Rhodomicrobium udaipurense]MBJ7543238.1 hypothetical protein [Rhodomicrobium udaipurense]
MTGTDFRMHFFTTGFALLGMIAFAYGLVCRYGGEPGFLDEFDKLMSETLANEDEAPFQGASEVDIAQARKDAIRQLEALLTQWRRDLAGVDNLQ